VGWTFENSSDFLTDSGQFTKNFLDSIEISLNTTGDDAIATIATKSSGLKIDDLVADVTLGEIHFVDLLNTKDVAPANFVATLLNGSVALETTLPDSVSGVLYGESALDTMREQSQFLDVLKQAVNAADAALALASGNVEEDQIKTDLSADLQTALADYGSLDGVSGLVQSNSFDGFTDNMIDLAEANELLALAKLNAQVQIEAAKAESDFLAMPQIRFVLEEIREGVVRGKNRAPDEPPGPPEVVSARDAVSQSSAGGVIFTLGNASEKVIGSDKADAYEVIPQAFEGINVPGGNADETGDDVIIDLARRVSTAQASQDDDVIRLDGVRDISDFDNLDFVRTQLKFEGQSSLKIDYRIYGEDEAGAEITNSGSLSVFKQYDSRTDRYGVEDLVLVDEFGVESIYDLGSAKRGFKVSDGNTENPQEFVQQDVLTLDATKENNINEVDEIATFKGILVGRDELGASTPSDWFQLEGLGSEHVNAPVDSEIRLYGVNAHDFVELVGLSSTDYDLTVRNDHTHATFVLQGNTDATMETAVEIVTDLDYSEAAQLTLIFRADHTDLDEVLFAQA
jgi:hypothetical protein